MVKNYIKQSNSRKLYIPFYLMILIILGIIIYMIYNNIQINSRAFTLAIIFIILTIKLTELHRFRESYKITSNYLETTKGIFSKETKKILIESIIDIDFKQNFWQRLLDFGSLEVYSFSGTNVIHVKNINNPSKFMRILDEKLDEKLNKNLK